MNANQSLVISSCLALLGATWMLIGWSAPAHQDSGCQAQINAPHGAVSQLDQTFRPPHGVGLPGRRESAGVR